MLTIVTDKCRTDSVNSMVVVLESDNRDELTSPAARLSALNAARQSGFPARGLGGVPNPYPVNAAGETNAQLIIGQEKIAAWRADFQVNAGIG